MSYPIHLHPDVIKYLDSLKDREKRRCYNSLKHLEENPHTQRSGCDTRKFLQNKNFVLQDKAILYPTVKKLRGKKKTAYRLRIGEHRFLYVIKSKDVYVEEAFRRGKGYLR